MESVKKNGFHDSMGRIGGLAVVDIVGTIGIAYVASKVLKTNFAATLVVCFIAGEVVHLAFKVETPITKAL